MSVVFYLPMVGVAKFQTSSVVCHSAWNLLDFVVTVIVNPQGGKVPLDSQEEKTS